MTPAPEPGPQPQPRTGDHRPPAAEHTLKDPKMTATPEERIEELEAELADALDQLVDRDDTIDDLKRKNEALEEKVQDAVNVTNELLRDLTR